MNRRVVGLAALVALVWGLCFVLIQASLPSLAPLFLAGLRALIGGGVLAAWVVARRELSSTRPPASGTRRRGPSPSGLPSLSILVFLALANATVAFGAMYLAAGRAEAAVASILAGGQPVVLVAAGWAFLGERTSARTIAGLVVAMTGVALVASGSGTTSPDGVALSLLATAAPAVGTVLMRRLGSSVDLLVTTSLQFLLGGAVLIVVSALLEPWGAVTWSPAALIGLLVLGVLGTGFAYVVWFSLLGRMSFANLGTVLFLVPVFGVVAGIVTGDRPAPAELAGLAAVLAGIAIISVHSGSTPGIPVRQVP